MLILIDRNNTLTGSYSGKFHCIASTKSISNKLANYHYCGMIRWAKLLPIGEIVKVAINRENQ